MFLKYANWDGLSLSCLTHDILFRGYVGGRSSCLWIGGWLFPPIPYAKAYDGDDQDYHKGNASDDNSHDDRSRESAATVTVTPVVCEWGWRSLLNGVESIQIRDQIQPTRAIRAH